MERNQCNIFICFNKTGLFLNGLDQIRFAYVHVLHTKEAGKILILICVCLKLVDLLLSVFQWKPISILPICFGTVIREKSKVLAGVEAKPQAEPRCGLEFVYHVKSDTIDICILCNNFLILIPYRRS